MLAVAATVVLAVFGVRDALLLAGSARPELALRLIVWALAVPALAIAACGSLTGFQPSILMWVPVVGGHVLRWAVACWLDARPRRNGLAWVTSLIPAPSVILAFIAISPPAESPLVVIWCGGVIIAALTVRRGQVEPILDDVGRRGQSLDLFAGSIAGIAYSTISASYIEMATLAGLSVILLWCGVRKARWN